MYLFGTQARGQSGGYQTIAQCKLEAKVYLDATLLPQGVSLPQSMTTSVKGKMAKILLQYNKDYTVPKSWYDIEKGLYHEDKDQAARDYALGEEWHLMQEDQPNS